MTKNLPLKEKFNQEVKPYLISRFGYKNPMAIPTLEKVAINMGLGDGSRDRKVLDDAVEELALITGQKPVITRARKAIANFKIRRGMSIGVRVTLRSYRMWDFLYRLFNIALPRVRDFRGISLHGFDGRGNFNLGIKDHLIFPEIDYAKVTRLKGMNISIVTTAKTDEESYELLKALGFPFQREETPWQRKQK